MIYRIALLAALAFLVLSACAASEPTTDGDAVTVFGPYRNVDAANFSKVLQQFEDETGVGVLYVGTGSLAHDLSVRVTEGRSPDVAMVPQPATVADLVEKGLVVPLDDAATAAVRENYLPAVQDLMMADGVFYSVLYRANVKSLVWYPPKVFLERGYEVPLDWAEMLDLTDQMKADGYTPWCFSVESFGATGWVGTDWVEDIMLRLYDKDTYDAWVSGDLPFEDELVRQAFEEFGSIVREPGNVYGGVGRSLSVSWTDAANPMFQEDPKCLLHRQASFYESQLPSDIQIGEDVDLFLLPSIGSRNAPPLLLGGDLAVALSNRPEVQELMAYLANPDSGKAWAAAGGYTSPHSTFEVGAYEQEMDRRFGEFLASTEVVAFDASDQMNPSVGTGTFFEGIVEYLLTGDLDATLALIDAGFDD